MDLATRSFATLGRGTHPHLGAPCFFGGTIVATHPLKRAHHLIVVGSAFVVFVIGLFNWLLLRNFNSEFDQAQITLAMSLRIGAEFNITGPLSIRLDGFTLVPFSKRTFGQEFAAIDTQNVMTVGTMAVGVWAVE